MENDFIFLAKYDRENNNLSMFENSGEWFRLHVEPFLYEQIKILPSKKMNLLPWQSEKGDNEPRKKGRGR